MDQSVRDPGSSRQVTRLHACALLLATCLVSLTGKAADCVKKSEICVEGRATRDISGLKVTRDCWRYRATYQCASTTTTNDCAPLRKAGCSQVGSRCVKTNSARTCTLYEQQWQCPAGGAQSGTITNCSGQQFCLDGKCFDTGHPPDPDFARVVAGLEAQREAGKYLDPNSQTVFKGFDNRCAKKLFGLVDCCAGGGSEGSALSNMNLITGAGGQVLGALGSTYVYDALFAADAPDFVLAGFEALFGAGGGSSALAGLLAGDVSVSSFMGAMVPGPWSLAMLAIQLSGLLSCEPGDQVLAMKRDKHLCHVIGSYCSLEVPVIGTCLESTVSHCCYNSRLARIIGEQGRAQLGRTFGSARRPDCSGFTLTELQGLDFSRMDLSEFYAEIAPTLPDVTALRARAQAKVQSYYTP